MRWGPGPCSQVCPGCPGRGGRAEPALRKQGKARPGSQGTVTLGGRAGPGHSPGTFSSPPRCPRHGPPLALSPGPALLPSPPSWQGPTAWFVPPRCLLRPFLQQQRQPWHTEKLETLPVAMLPPVSAGWVPLLPPAKQACGGEQDATLTRQPASTAVALNEGSFFLTEAVLPSSCSSLGTAFPTLQGQS